MIAAADRQWDMYDLRSMDHASLGLDPFEMRSPAGVRITPETALQCSAFLACVRVISESVASLPLHVFRRLATGGKEKAPDHPLYRLLHRSPNPWQTSMEFREQMTALYLMYGQSFAEIIAGPAGFADQLVPLHPSRMTVEMVEGGRLRYRYRDPAINNRERVYTQEQIYHLRWLSLDGINGEPPVALSRSAIALARALEVHGSSYFGNGARPGVVLESDSPIPPEAADRLREQWERMHRGPDRAHRTAVLPNGVKAHELSGSNEAAQFLETRQYQVVEVCRQFRMPPHMIQDLTRSTYSNIEVQGTEFVQHCLLPHCKRWEAAIARDLLTDDRLFAEHSMTALLRGDSAARSTYYREMLNIGVLSVNEIRELENLNPIGPEGDQRFMQVNMTTLQQIAAGDTQPQAGVAVEDEGGPDDDTEDQAEQEGVVDGQV
jgi:HK97 family phage portal protein